jgi:hypothetical protein
LVDILSQQSANNKRNRSNKEKQRGKDRKGRRKFSFVLPCVEDGREWRSHDEERIDHDHIEDVFVLLPKVPRSFFSELLGKEVRHVGECRGGVPILLSKSVAWLNGKMED